MITETTKWVQIQWPYNSMEPYASWECWECKFPHFGHIILHPGQWPEEGWFYVMVSSHSGFLRGFTTIEAAKEEIERRVRMAQRNH